MSSVSQFQSLMRTQPRRLQRTTLAQQERIFTTSSSQILQRQSSILLQQELHTTSRQLVPYMVSTLVHTSSLAQLMTRSTLRHTRRQESMLARLSQQAARLLSQQSSGTTPSLASTMVQQTTHGCGVSHFRLRMLQTSSQRFLTFRLRQSGDIQFSLSQASTRLSTTVLTRTTSERSHGLTQITHGILHLRLTRLIMVISSLVTMTRFQDMRHMASPMHMSTSWHSHRLM